jgi:hypothetical protein
VHVVEDDDDRTLPRQRLQQSADRPEDLLGAKRTRAEAEQAAEAVGDRSSLWVAADDGGDPFAALMRRQRGAEPGCSLDDLDHRPERDALPIGQAAPDQHCRLVLDLGEELRGQTRLPRSGRPEHRHELAGLVGLRSFEGLAQHRQLALAADERGVEAARNRRSPGDHTQHPPGGHRLGLTLELERLDRLDKDGVAHEVVRRVADQYLAGPRRRLEPRSDVNRVAGNERLPRRGVAGHNLARVDAGADSEVDPPAFLELAV